MAKKKGPVTRESVTDPPVWRKPPRGTSKTDIVKLFRNANPIFTQQEVETVLGPEYVGTLESLVSQGELKRQARGIFSRIEYDQTHSDVQKLITLHGSVRTTPERLAKQAERAARRIAAQQEEELRRRPAAKMILRPRVKVFSTYEAWNILGYDPRPTITQMMADGVIDAVHAGLYRRRDVSPCGPEVFDWAEKHASKRADIVRSIDASQAANSVRDGEGAPRVNSIRLLPKDSYSPRDRVRITFARLGWIQAVAGGPGRKHAAWQSYTPKTHLTKDAAAFIAEQIFGRDILWGDLLALTRRHHENHDKNPLTSETLPRFKTRSYLDYGRRMRDKGTEARYTALRQGRIEEGPMHPEKPCILYVDQREDKRIVDALQGIENLHVVVVTLETGDFHACWGEEPSQQLYIERKTGPDFQATIIYRDLQSQVARLAELARKGARSYLLQQGDAYDVPPTQVDYRGETIGQTVSSSKKAHSYAAMSAMGIGVVPVANWQDAAKAILDLVCYTMTPSLLPWITDPKTTVEEISTESCVNQENIAV